MQQASVEQLADREAFVRQWTACQGSVYAYIRTLVPCRNDAEEVLQETAIVLWRKFDQFEPGSRFDCWAYKVAYHQVLYHRQRKQRDARVFSQPLVEHLALHAESSQENFSHYLNALEGCLLKLAPSDRELLRRRYDAGSTGRDVAQSLGRSESAVSRALNRIYLALQRCIEINMARDCP